MLEVQDIKQYFYLEALLFSFILMKMNIYSILRIDGEKHISSVANYDVIITLIHGILK